MINLKPNHNEPRSGRRIGLCIRLKQKSPTKPNWSVTFSGQSTEDGIWKTGSVTTQYAKSYCQHIALFSSISSKVEDNATKNKTCIDTECKSEKMAVALILTSSCYQVLWEMRIRLANILPAALFIFTKWCHVWCSNLFKLFVNVNFTEHFHFSGFPLCLTH